jgi:hypothetical protein
MAAKDVTKTAIITPFDLFEYLFMPFVLRNAAQAFQRFKDSLFNHLPFVFCYLDDIIVISHTLEKHRKHLRQIFSILQENGPADQPSKVRVRRCRHGVLGTPGGPARRPAAPAARTGH